MSTSQDPNPKHAQIKAQVKAFAHAVRNAEDGLVSDRPAETHMTGAIGLGDGFTDNSVSIESHSASQNTTEDKTSRLHSDLPLLPQIKRFSTLSDLYATRNWSNWVPQRQQDEKMTASTQDASSVSDQGSTSTDLTSRPDENQNLQLDTTTATAVEDKEPPESCAVGEVSSVGQADLIESKTQLSSASGAAVASANPKITLNSSNTSLLPRPIAASHACQSTSSHANAAPSELKSPIGPQTSLQKHKSTSTLITGKLKHSLRKLSSSSSKLKSIARHTSSGIHQSVENSRPVDAASEYNNGRMSAMRDQMMNHEGLGETGLSLEQRQELVGGNQSERFSTIRKILDCEPKTNAAQESFERTSAIPTDKPYPVNRYPELLVPVGAVFGETAHTVRYQKSREAINRRNAL